MKDEGHEYIEGEDLGDNVVEGVLVLDEDGEFEHPIPIENALKNPRHELFCQKYVMHHNATQAAREVGFKNGNGLKVTAHDILHRPEVKARIRELKAHAEKLLGFSRLSMLRHLSNIASDEKEISFARLQAITLLSKMMGYDKDVPVDEEVTIDIPVIKWLK